MEGEHTDGDVDHLLGELVRSLRRLETAVGPPRERGVVRPPTPREMARFTREVGIPAVILVLRVNIETLLLLQRTLRFVDRGDAGSQSPGADLTDRTRRVTATALDGLDDALSDVEAAIDGRPPDADARDLLDRVRDLRTEIDAQLETSATPAASSDADVPVNVEAELRSIRDAVDASDGTPDESAPGEEE
jgi:hypothetical protein